MLFYFEEETALVKITCKVTMLLSQSEASLSLSLSVSPFSPYLPPPPILSHYIKSCLERSMLLGRPGWPLTHTDSPVSTAQVLGLKVFAIGFYYLINSSCF